MGTQSYAWSYTPIDGFNILSGLVTLFEDQLNPGDYLLFANTTYVEPKLEAKKGFAIHFNTSKQDWEYVENHIGEIGYIDDIPHTVSTYGPLPDGFKTELSIASQISSRLTQAQQICLYILKSTDFLVMPDYPLSEQDKLLIIEFRNQIRNLDKSEGYPWLNQPFNLPAWPLTSKKCPYNLKEDF